MKIIRIANKDVSVDQVWEQAKDFSEHVAEETGKTSLDGKKPSRYEISKNTRSKFLEQSLNQIVRLMIGVDVYSEGNLEHLSQVAELVKSGDQEQALFELNELRYALESLRENIVATNSFAREANQKSQDTQYQMI